MALDLLQVLKYTIRCLLELSKTRICMRKDCQWSLLALWFFATVGKETMQRLWAFKRKQGMTGQHDLRI